MKTILPAVLSDKVEDYEKAIRIFEEFPDNKIVHIDIMDGNFVETTSDHLSQVLEIQTDLKRQVHLMIEDPIDEVRMCYEDGVEEVIIHYQSDLPEFSLLEQYEGTDVFLAINPEIQVQEIKSLLEKFSGILIMTVNPGRQGTKFLPENFQKVTELRDLGYKGKIIVDGGINIDTITQGLQFDVDEFVVGSGIVKQDNPGNAYEKLVETLEG